MCDGGQREHTNLCQADLATVASYSYTTLHCIFLPCSLSFHLCISFSLLTQGLAPSPRYPLRWIYQKSGQRPSLSSGLDQIYLGLRALFSALFLRGGWGLEREFLTKLWWLKDIWDGGAGEFPTGHIPLSSIFIQICFLHWNQSRAEKRLQYPHDHVTANSCKTPNGNGKTAV